jgi:uncharacterized membrane protein
MSSNFNKATKIIFVILVFTIFIYSIYASDISVIQGSNSGAICPGTTNLITDVVNNNGNNELQFTITNSGSSSGFTTTTPPGFILAPGQSKTIYTYISPRTTTEVGKYTLNLNVQAGSNSEIISHSIDIKDCRSFSLVAKDSASSVCPADIQKYEFLLSNTGENTETFDLRTEGQIAPWATISETTITLARQESKSIFVYVNTPSDALGNYDFSLIATSRSNKKVQTAEVSLNVNSCFDYTLTTKKDSVSMCEKSQEIIPVQITNKGTVDNNYNLALDGPEWASLENNQVQVGKGESKSVNIILNPDYGVSGDFKVSFQSTTDKGKIESSNEFNINVKTCHGVDVQIEKNQDKICNSLSNTYNVLVKNTGEFQKDFKLDLIGPVWTTLSSDRISLNPEEERKLTLTINPGFDIGSGDYDITVRATGLDSSKVSSEAKLTITTISKEECYKPVIGIKDKELEVYYDSSATIPIVIENKGNEKATYDIGVSGTASSFVHLNPAVVTVEPNQAEIIYLYAAPNSETPNGDYSATVSVRLKDSTILASDVINLKVSQSKAPIEITQTQNSGEKKSLWQKIVDFFTSKNTSTPSQETNEVGNVTVLDNSTTQNETTTTEEENLTGNQTVINQPTETTTLPTAKTIDLVTAKKQLVNQELNQKVVFTINNTEHTATLNNVSGDVVYLVIRSDPIYTNLSVGQSAYLDTDGNGVNDLKVTLMGFKADGRADILYENLLLPAVTQPTTEETTEQTNETILTNETGNESDIIEPVTTESPTTNFFSLYAKYIIAGIIILILLVLVIKYRKGIKEFFEEEIEEEVPPKKEVPKEVKKEEPHKKEVPKEVKKEEVKKEEPHKKEVPKEVKKDEKKTLPKKKKEVDEEEYY